MNLRGICLTLLIWAISTFVFVVIGVVALDWQKWNGIARYGITINGNVVGKEPENHNFIRYSYMVNGSHYSGLGSAGGENRDFDQLHVGDAVKVTYDSRQPEESILGNAQFQASSVTRGVIFLGVIGPLFSMIAMYAKGWLPIRRI
jgi:hypothetical protein